MDLFEFGPVLSTILALGPTLVMLCMVSAFLARHFRISLLLMAIADAAWLVISGYSQYLIWTGGWNEGGLSVQVILHGIGQVMNLLNLTGMLLLLMEWSRLVRDREATPPLI